MATPVSTRKSILPLLSFLLPRDLSVIGDTPLEKSSKKEEGVIDEGDLVNKYMKSLR